MCQHNSHQNREPIMLKIMLAGPRYNYDHKQYTVWGQYAMHDIYSYPDQWLAIFFTWLLHYAGVV